MLKKILVGVVIFFAIVVVFGTLLEKTPGETPETATTTNPPAMVQPQTPAPSAAIPAAAVMLEAKEQRLNDGSKGLILSVREPVTEQQVEKLVDQARVDGYKTLRVFTYAAGVEHGKDAASGLWEWRYAEGVKKRY